jgi:ABC-type uncharacterized transport system substrate-binding protein
VRRISLPCALLFLAVALPVTAHPHVFIDNRMTVVFDNGVLKGISFRWTFDDVFSNMILADYDPRRTGKLTDAQSRALKQGAFDNLSNYHYFVAFWIGKKPLRQFTIEQFTPSVVDGRSLIYSFFVPLSIPVTSTEQTILVTVYDDSYYVAFDILRAGDVTVAGGGHVDCALSVQKTQVKPEWPGQYMPDQLAIRFKEKQ